MNRILLPATLTFLLVTATPHLTSAAEPVAQTPAAQTLKQLEAQIAAREQRAADFKKQIQVLDERIQSRVTKTVKALENLGDSKDSGTRVANIKADVIDFLRKQITDYARRRAQLRAEMDNAQRVILEADLESDIAFIDERIDLRIAQVVALGGSFAEHRDYDKYTTSGDDWWGGTDYRVNEDWKQNRRETRKADEQKGKVMDALDQTIKRLEFENRSLKIRLSTASAASATRLQADIAHNEALIETLRGKRVEMFAGSGKPTRLLSVKEAIALTDRLKEVGAEIRRDQNKLTGFYNELNGERYQLALLEARKKAVTGVPKAPR